ncbi:MAG: MFS transporter [Legionella sp.]|uniref:MFS transporter n=1 Tax=Legionella sp. TaxID=459 RepID=UPI0039E3A273
MNVNKVKAAIITNYLVNYIEVPKGTGKVLPLVVIESLAMCVAHLISIYLTNALHFTPFQVGKLISVLALGTCVGSLCSGYLTTRISVLRVSSLGLLIYALGFLLLFYVTSYHFLLAVLFFCGLGGVFMMIGNLTALIKLANNDSMKNRVIVLQAVVFNLSYSISSFFMSYFSAQVFKNIFLIFAVFLSVAGVYLLQQKDNTPVFITEKKLVPLKIKWSLTAILMLAIFFYGVIYSLIRVYFPVEALSRFHNPFYSWLALSMNPLMIILFQPVLINALGNKTNRALLMIGAFCLGMGYLLFGFTSYLLPSLCCITLAAVGEMIFSPISKKLAATSLGVGNEGMGLAIWKLTFYFSGVLGATFVGYLGEYYKAINIWLTCIPLTLAIILCALCYRDSSKGIQCA